MRYTMDSLILFVQYITAMFMNGFRYDTTATVMISVGIVVVALVLTFVTERLFAGRKAKKLAKA